MAFTRDWNPAYEAIPASVDDASEGATRIQQFKVDVRERLDVDHAMAGTADDGKHDQATLIEKVAIGSPGAGFAILANKNGDLFYKTAAGVEVQITSGGSVVAATSEFAVGTPLWFYLNAAPTGWTIAVLSDKVLAIKGGTTYTAGAATAGAWTHTHAAGAHTHTVGSHTHSIPSHAHSISHTHASITYSYTGGTLAHSASYSGNSGSWSGTSGSGSGSTGSSSGTTDANTSFRPEAAVGIVCTKN